MSDLNCLHKDRCHPLRVCRKFMCCFVFITDELSVFLKDFRLGNGLGDYSFVGSFFLCFSINYHSSIQEHSGCLLCSSLIVFHLLRM